MIAQAVVGAPSGVTRTRGVTSARVARPARATTCRAAVETKVSVGGATLPTPPSPAPAALPSRNAARSPRPPWELDVDCNASPIGPRGPHRGRPRPVWLGDSVPAGGGEAPVPRAPGLRASSPSRPIAPRFGRQRLAPPPPPATRAARGRGAQADGQRRPDLRSPAPRGHVRDATGGVRLLHRRHRGHAAVGHERDALPER